MIRISEINCLATTTKPNKPNTGGLLAKTRHSAAHDLAGFIPVGLARSGGAVFAALLLSVLCGRAAVFDYSAPLQDVEYDVLSIKNTIRYRVYDPNLGAWQEDKKLNGGPQTDISNVGGVLAWRYKRTMYYRVYDPQLGAWREGEKLNGGPQTDISNVRGVLAWRYDRWMYFRVYDHQRGAWREGERVNGAAQTDISNVSGIISWRDRSTMYYRVYDPKLGAWKDGSTINGGPQADISNVGGVVAWRYKRTMYYRIYDPKQSAWKESKKLNGGPQTDISNVGGVVAWRYRNRIYYVVYDPDLRAWRGAYDINSSDPTDLEVSATGTVTWTAGEKDFTRGYDHATGSWYSGPTLPFANFFLSREFGNAPLFVWLVDMSIGGTAWDWIFEDGGLRSQRAGFYLFEEFGRFTVTQVVTGQPGDHRATAIVSSDEFRPSGSVTINNGDLYVGSTAVTLTLAATDNSGSVAYMRFSKNGRDWSKWEPYATSKGWTLSSGDGVKTVYAQFRDAAENDSATVSDMITLYTPQMVEIIYDRGGDTFRFTWTSKPNRVYALFFSTDLSEFDANIDDSIDSQGDTTTFPPIDQPALPNPLPGTPRIYFRAQET